MKTQKITEIDNAMQLYFRTSRRIRINGRRGAFVIVDDREEIVNLVKNMFVVRGENQVVLSASNVSEAKDIIKKRQIKAVVIDLGLNGEGENGNGFNIANWLNEEYPDIPFVFATGKKNKVKEIERRFPGVDIFIKGQNTIEDFACALGMDENSNEVEIIPKDIDKNIEVNNSSFIKKVFNFVF